MKKKNIILFIILIPAFILWNYVWFDSARRYVHAELADQFIELRTKEHAVVSMAISDLEQQDINKANKRLRILSEIYTEDLNILERSLATEGGVIESLVISRENMETLRQFVAKYSLSIEFSDESH